ncbi:MAG: hypothetical protein E7587_02125 [Ruminococcaceae bacterium]|nr:hypothetical protein [Oscillospiraceae bacterium]
MFSENTENLFLCLPPQIVREVRRISESYTDFEEKLSEIRIRAGRLSSVSLRGRVIPLSVFVTEEQIRDSLKLFCRGSVYAYSESLKEGYIAFEGGYRVGVSGRAVYENGIICGVGEVSSLCVRIPHNIRGAADIVIETFERLEFRQGILIYSQPGNGKTTMLRDCALQLSSGKYHKTVALIDTREELSGSFIGRECAIDVLKGYPKAAGIEIATRTLSPDVIICDEIGGYEEALSILETQSCGVPLIASAHGGSLSEIFSRGSVKILAENGVFGAYIYVKRENENKYTYTVNYSEI